MLNENQKTLELDKILSMLSDECTLEESKKQAKEITPSDDLFTVRQETGRTSDALELTIKYGTPGFFAVKNPSGILKRAKSGGTLSLGELLEIKRLLAQAEALSKWYDSLEIKETSLDFLFECVYPNHYLWQKLENAILDEERLSDEASPELKSIRQKITRSGLKIRETLDKMIKSSQTQKYLQEAIVTIRDGRFVIPVKTEFKGNVDGLVHDTSATGSTLFIEPMSVVEANNDIRILEGREQEEIHRIISELSMECAEISEQLESTYKAAVKLNLYFAKANLGAKMKAMLPEITDDGKTILNKARHPLIDPKKCVPINFEIGEDYTVLIITGPNTGGKTVALKTVGLLTLMTMCGLLIPASDGSKISIFRNILVDIGDNQSIENNLSTFSSHIQRVKNILDTADSESLVLIDELGSGTDPVEGAALAVSVIERLRALGTILVTTTHYQELKMYAIDTKGVQNASCEFDVEKMKPTYKLVIGSPGKSNAFAISENLGIDKDIIEYAKSLISKENRRFENIIDSLEKTRIQLEENNAEAEKNRAEAEKLKEELEQTRENLYRQKEKELEKARLEANEIVKKVQRQSQELVDELNKIRKEKENPEFAKLAASAKQKQKSAMKQIYLDANPVTAEKEDDYVLPRPLKKGDSVKMIDTDRKAIVVSPPDEKGMCFVQAGIMKTKIDVKKLRLIEKQQPVKTPPKNKKGKSYTTSGVESRRTRQFSTELDIRGYAADDGVYAVDSFIDNAVMSGITLVTIIHGRGTGVLKNAVRNHLKHHPSVKSSRPGIYGEGEDGVTVVELK